ncbi:Neuronal membrane glycoprotein M6-a [Bagarius yarrelli]|uniref:Neuronal membrane glycoprotein M6-a n=1 Tax=Bagarius yarrelli TaxID=175774 RepID=A0A556V6W3_BAGYA|nr:Neuronal membrane glycoprotein M6-a [Bagarius yarrelli]
MSHSTSIPYKIDLKYRKEIKKRLDLAFISSHPLRVEGCSDCCIKCLSGIPYASLIATILLYAGVALFCGCGHEALSGTVTILQNYFEVVQSSGETLDVFTMIDILKYVIYGVAAAFFVYGILLMVEGFFTTGAIRDLYGDFKITTCGRCVSAWFIMLTYVFMLAWLGVTAFTSLPVFMYFNIWNTCQNMTVTEAANLCFDLRQFGIVTITEDRKICTGLEKFSKMCALLTRWCPALSSCVITPPWLLRVWGDTARGSEAPPTPHSITSHTLALGCRICRP